MTGRFPFDLVMSEEIRQSIDKYMIPPIGKWDKALGVAWFIPREVLVKKTKNGKPYWIVKVVDDTSASLSIKCWGVSDFDTIHINRPYAGKLDFSEEWGFSTRSISKNLKLLG